MSDRRPLDAVDAALESARRAAGEARLPPKLRARILAATRSAASATPLARPVAPAPRARLVDLALRAAAVAAVFAAALLVAPVSIEAAEFDAKPLVEWNARFADAVAGSLPVLDVAAATDVPAGLEWPLVATSLALVAVGCRLARRDGRR
jgi:hypothetical protein